MEDTIILLDEEVIYELLTEGEQGPVGPRGADGPLNSGFNWAQSLSSTSWVIPHNLSYKPAVTTLTVGGVAMLGSVTHISNNVIQIDFNSPVAGTAHLI